MKTNSRNHWELFYETKQPNEVSWTQENSKISLDYIRETDLYKSVNQNFVFCMFRKK
ncbi:hypothetical protein SAMN05216269_103209 [Flavobacterium xinjiangense]|uniref:Uncharacterized protein n=1 Tax=Flavobacterium xinjiangense TaxID=178356 RepID=A0A1M7HAG4_9FLAO|nr:hypothetical protein SAMN05216269_103209 [Flavobacterium xinjiangense]